MARSRCSMSSTTCAPARFPAPCSLVHPRRADSIPDNRNPSLNCLSGAAEGFLFVFSITERETLTRIHQLHEYILSIKGQESIPGIIVANKCDLELERQVQSTGMFYPHALGWALGSRPRHAEGRELAQHLGYRFIETSAKQCLNVDEAFAELVREIRQHNGVDRPL
jgi:GTPase SAR1 family protein